MHWQHLAQCNTLVVLHHGLCSNIYLTHKKSERGFENYTVKENLIKSKKSWLKL